MISDLKIPEKYQSYLRIGTCSWKYDSWKGLVYDPDKKYDSYDYLPDYAKFFNTVEIDQWFWSLFPQGAKLPDPKTIRRYADSVPDDFLFTVKVPNSITLTHYYAKQPPASKAYANRPNSYFLDVKLLNHFFETLEPMKDKLGPVMFQFEYLNKKKMPSKAVYLERLNDFFDFLRKRGLGFVLIEGYYMPHIADIAAEFDVRTADFSIIRLHGPDREGIEERTGGQWDRIVDPKDEGLRTTVSIIKENVRKGIRTFVNVNNHYEGCAPQTIERLLKPM